MRLKIEYLDFRYETYDVENDAFDQSVSAGLGLHIRTKADPNFSSQRFFIPFTAIKKITIEETD